MQRQVIRIDEDRCTGCAECIPNCPEGAIQIIDGKARLVSDLFCDGLGACIGHCPEGAITFEEREAAAYDERQVIENIARQGTGVITEHLRHLKEHGQTAYLKEAVDYLKEKGILSQMDDANPAPSGCPGSRSIAFAAPIERSGARPPRRRPSQLTHWPIQMHLISPHAQHYRGADILLAADCVAFAVGDFHRDYLKGKALAVACPKLDSDQEIYVQKLKALIDEAKINSVTVMIMQVPCCGGLLRLAQTAAAGAGRKVPIKLIVVGLRGEILKEEWA